MTVFNDEFPLMMEREVGMPPNVPPVAVAFGLHPQQDAKASKKAGHPVFTDVEFAKICIPGDKTSLYFQPATQRDRDRFPQAYAAFKKRGETPVNGMPIEQWAVIPRSLALTLRACHISTVEALAAVHDGHVDKLGFNARELRAKAQAWLASAKDNAETVKLAEEKKALQDQLAAMQAQIAALSASASPQQKAAMAMAAAKPVAPIPDLTEGVEAEVIAQARKPRARARAAA